MAIKLVSLTRHDPVSAGCLCLEQSSIRSRDERVRRASIIVQFAHADAKRNALLPPIKMRLGNGQAHAFCKPDCAVKMRLREDHQELLAAITTNVVACAGQPGDDLRYAVQSLVAELVSVRVINFFEVVEVDH